MIWNTINCNTPSNWWSWTSGFFSWFFFFYKFVETTGTLTGAPLLSPALTPVIWTTLDIDEVKISNCLGWKHCAFEVKKTYSVKCIDQTSLTVDPSSLHQYLRLPNKQCENSGRLGIVPRFLWLWTFDRNLQMNLRRNIFEIAIRCWRFLLIGNCVIKPCSGAYGPCWCMNVRCWAAQYVLNLDNVILIHLYTFVTFVYQSVCIISSTSAHQP